MRPTCRTTEAYAPGDPAFLNCRGFVNAPIEPADRGAGGPGVPPQAEDGDEQEDQDVADQDAASNHDASHA